MTSPPSASIQRKRAARLAAVQILYSQEIMGHAEDAEVAVRQFCQQLIEARGEASSPEKGESLAALEPDTTYLTKLVGGVEAGREALDGIVAPLLSKDRKMETLGPLLRSVFRAAALELERRMAPPRAIVDEYMSVAAEFFDTGELRFINGVLDALAKRGASSLSP